MLRVSLFTTGEEETIRAQVSCASEIVGLFIDDNTLVDMMSVTDGVWLCDQVSMLEATVTNWSHLCLFLPKFHCEFVTIVMVS